MDDLPPLPKATEPHVSPVLLRLGAGVVLVPLFGFLTLFAVSFTSYGTEEQPVDQFRRDLPMLVTGALAGVVAGMTLAYAVFGAQRVLLWMGALLGLAPALLVSVAYFTEAM